MNVLQLFGPPHYDDPELNRAARLLFGLLGLTTLAFVLLPIATVLFQPVNTWRALTSTLIILGLSLISLWLLGHGRLKTASAIFVFQIWTVVTVSAVTGGGMETPAVQGYLVVMLAAGLLIGWRVGLLTGIVCVATQLALTYFEITGGLPPFAGLRTPVTYLLVYTLVSGLAVIFVYYYTSSIRTSLGLAKQELAERKRAVQALAESEARQRTFAGATFEAIAIFVDGRLVECNDQLARMLGRTVDEMLGAGQEMFVAPESRALATQYTRAQLTEPYEIFFLRKDGSKFPAEVRGHPFDYQGKPGRLSVARDLTEQKKAEAELLESEERFQNAFDYAAIGMAVVTLNGGWLRVNQSLCRLVGYTEEELLPKTFRGITYPEDIDNDLDLMQRLLAGEIRTYQLEKRYIHKNGSLVWVRLSVSLVRNPTGEPLYFISQIEDISQRKQAELEKERSNYLMRERLKELTTLHQTAQLLQTEHDSLGHTLQAIVEVLPPAWQYPELTEARIQFDGVDYQTTGFQPTPWMQRAEFRTQAGKAGVIEVAYREEKPPEVEGPFFTEERNLIDTLAEMLQTDLGRRQAEAHGQQQLAHITSLHDIDSAILTSTDLRLTLEIIIGEITGHLGADAAAVFLLNRPLATLEYAAGRGFRMMAIPLDRPRVGEAYAGQVVLNRRLVNMPSIVATASDSPRKRQFLSEGFVSYLGLPLIAKGEMIGVLEIFHRTARQLEAEWLEFVTALAGQAAIAVDSLRLFEELKRRNMELALAYDVTLEGWSKALDLRDKETEGHSLRVTDMTLRLAEAMGLPEADLAHIRQGALLHDVGKLGIPDSILLKPGKLTDEEWTIMRMHPVYAYEWLSPIDYLKRALDIPYCHHEKWDGSGYPRGLTGEAIPQAARLFAIVDVYDALTSDRPYRKALTQADTLDYIKAQSGKHFDPRVVDVFGRLMQG